MRRIVLAAAICLMPAAAVRAAYLTAEEIKSKVIDKNFDWTNPKDKTAGTLVFKADGSFVMTVKENNIVNQDIGSWYMKGNRICLKWSLILKGRQRCFGLADQGAGKYHAENGIDWVVK